MNAPHAGTDGRAAVPAPQSPAPSVTLHIERLVLDGITLPPGGAARLSAALEAELTRLLREGGIAETLISGDGLSVPDLSLAAPALSGTPATMGTTLARALYAGIGTPSLESPSREGGDAQ